MDQIVSMLPRRIEVKTYSRTTLHDLRILAASNFQLGEVPGAGAVATVDANADGLVVHGNGGLAAGELDAADLALGSGGADCEGNGLVF